MSYFWQVFQYYQKPLKGLFYMPARWAIVPFVQIESYLPRSGLIIDVGCGEGVMATLLAISAKDRKVIGLDLNDSKINLAKSLTSDIPNLQFKKIDILKTNPPLANGYILSDFLHHISKSSHLPLLSKIASSLKKNGVLVIKDIDAKDGIRSKVSRFFDFLFYPRDKIDFIYSDEISSFLKKKGLKIKVVKVKKWFPGSTTLFIGQK